MAVEQAYRCDLCGEYVHRDALRKLAVRNISDRPEDGDRVDVGPCCYDRPVRDVIAHAAQLREATANGTAAPL